MSEIDRTFLTIDGREPCEGISFAVASGPILIIKPDGELVFGDHAHPQEAVDILMRVWRKTLKRDQINGERILVMEAEVRRLEAVIRETAHCLGGAVNALMEEGFCEHRRLMADECVRDAGAALARAEARETRCECRECMAIPKPTRLWANQCCTKNMKLEPDGYHCIYGTGPDEYQEEMVLTQPDPDADICKPILYIDKGI